MNGKKINIHPSEPRVLIAPLDWGLGHVTRCVPIIYALIAAGATVFLAGDKAMEVLIKKEFPQLVFLPLKGYKVRYAQNKRHFLMKLVSQFPRIQNIISYEHNWLKKVAKVHKLDGIISDNRFGLSHTTIHTVYITHQLHIETGNAFLNRLAQRIHYKYINQFNQCWVPDEEGDSSLAGYLSHPPKLPAIAVKYLGTLSRFKKEEIVKTNKLLVVLSGPEPQRSIFEKLILEQLKDFSGSAILVRGLPLEESVLPTSKNLVVHNYLASHELSIAIQQSELVLARAGYSTIMDLATLAQKAILVPTPGQAEQEYLAAYLKKQGFFYTCGQGNFNLKKALLEAESFYKKDPPSPVGLNIDVIKNWLEELKRSMALQ